METTTQPNISSSNVQAGMSSSISNSVLLQTYTNTVIITPIINLPAVVDTDSKSKVVENLPIHQKLAQKNATYYLTNINPQIVGTIADVIGFGNLWSAEYDMLYSLAQNINEGNNLQTFTSGINNLINKTNSADANIQPVIDALNAFLPLITTDEQNFSQDSTDVGNAMEGEGGEIDLLKKQIAAYNDAMSKDLTIIGVGATADVIGGLMIAVGVLAEIETAGVSTALVVAGIAVVAGGSTAMGVAGADYAKVSKEYQAAVTELNQDEQVVTLTTQAHQTVLSLKNAVAEGITAVLNLQKSWTSLQKDFGQVLEALQATVPVTPDIISWLTILLSSANKDWTDTLSIARNIQQYSTLPVQQTNI